MTGPPGPVIPCQRRRPARCPRLRTAGRYAARASRSTVTVLAVSTGIDRTALARRIYDVSHLTGSFTLRSGVVSDQYFDKYRFEADPALLAEIAAAVAALVPAESDALAGLELGGVPIATMAAQVLGLPARFVRKAAKDVRHVRDRRGWGSRRDAAVHHRGCRDIRGRGARRGGGLARPRREPSARSCA